MLYLLSSHYIVTLSTSGHFSKQCVEAFVVTLGALPEEDFEMSVDHGGDDESRAANVVTELSVVTHCIAGSTMKVAEAFNYMNVPCIVFVLLVDELFPET